MRHCSLESEINSHHAVTRSSRISILESSPWRGVCPTEDSKQMDAVAVGSHWNKKAKRLPDAVLGFSESCKANREALLPRCSLGFTSQP